MKTSTLAKVVIGLWSQQGKSGNQYPLVRLSDLRGTIARTGFFAVEF